MTTPGAKMKLAVMNGNTELLEMFKGNAPWDEFLEGSSFAEIMRDASYYFGGNRNAEDTVLMMLDMAIADGKQGMFHLEECDKGGTSYVEPILSFIENDFNKAIAVFMNHGFDARQVYGIDGLNGHDVANEKDKDATVAMFLAHEARRVANDALLDMETSPAAKSQP